MPDLGWSEHIASVENSAFVEAVMECQWFVDEGGSLLIPDPWGDDYCVDTGVSTGAVSRLNSWYQSFYNENPNYDGEKLPEVPEDIYTAAGLSLVAQPLKRWNEVDGFYYA